MEQNYEKSAEDGALEGITLFFSREGKSPPGNLNKGGQACVRKVSVVRNRSNSRANPRIVPPSRSRSVTVMSRSIPVSAPAKATKGEEKPDETRGDHYWGRSRDRFQQVTLRASEYVTVPRATHFPFRPRHEHRPDRESEIRCDCAGAKVSGRGWLILSLRGLPHAPESPKFRVLPTFDTGGSLRDRI